MNRRGIFFKVFTYTAIFLVVIVCVTVGLFSQQFLSFYNTTQTQQLYASYQILYEQLSGKDNDEVIRAAGEFYIYNQSFAFYIMDDSGNVVFSTPDINTGDDFNAGELRIRMTVGSNFTLYASDRTTTQANYSNLIQKSLLAFVCMLAMGILGAFIFARQITNPIKKLANDTKKMAAFEDVNPLPVRHDEIGNLARDVHLMYHKLKEAIANQRYFFSAASHELKTPIAAASVLLEGMLENIGDYQDHPKYLKECIRLMGAQSKTITEILELVKLNDSEIVQDFNKVDIKKVIMSVMPEHQTLADANGQRITVNVADGYVCSTDNAMLKKVLSNIILNAVQNTPKNGEIKIWSEPVSDQYRVYILNTGAIDEEVLPKLFDPFYRLDKARNRKDGRSGLGLTIVQKTLDTMGVEFELSNTAEGVLFWLDLPAV